MNRCVWLTRDHDGRPSCEHGKAHKAGTSWRCPLKNYLANRRYDRTDKGRATTRRANANPYKRSIKELYELTRIRVS